MNGIEDWVGGVHLDSRVGDVWYHQDKKIVGADARSRTVWVTRCDDLVSRSAISC